MADELDEFLRRRLTALESAAELADRPIGGVEGSDAADPDEVEDILDDVE